MSQCADVPSPGLGSELLGPGSGSASNLTTASYFRAVVAPSVKWEGWAKWFSSAFPVLGFCFD